MYTECPSCKTFFRITPEQLKAAAGKVRCGSCSTVFNALESLSDNLPAAATTPAPQSRATEEAPQAEAAGSSFEDIEVPGTDEGISEEAAQGFGEAGEESEGFEIAPEEPLSTLEDLFAEDEGEIAKDLELEQMEESFDEDAPDDLDRFEEDAAAKTDLSDDISEFADKTESKLEDFDVDDYVLEEIQGGEQERSYKWLSTTLWSVLIVALVAVLSGQYAYFQRAELAKYPALQPWLERMCDVVSRFAACDVPPPRDITAIRLLERDVRSDPEIPNTLLISATMVNEARFIQPYPSMTLRFSDINQNPVAQREFSPAEYLGDDIDIEAGMKQGVPVRVGLKIKDPGEEAVNFEFTFE